MDEEKGDGMKRKEIGNGSNLHLVDEPVSEHPRELHRSQQPLRELKAGRAPEIHPVDMQRHGLPRNLDDEIELERVQVLLRGRADFTRQGLEFGRFEPVMPQNNKSAEIRFREGGYPCLSRFRFA